MKHGMCFQSANDKLTSIEEIEGFSDFFDFLFRQSRALNYLCSSLTHLVRLSEIINCGSHPSGRRYTQRQPALYNNISKYNN